MRSSRCRRSFNALSIKDRVKNKSGMILRRSAKDCTSSEQSRALCCRLFHMTLIMPSFRVNSRVLGVGLELDKLQKQVQEN